MSSKLPGKAPKQPPEPRAGGKSRQGARSPKTTSKPSSPAPAKPDSSSGKKKKALSDLSARTINVEEEKGRAAIQIESQSAQDSLNAWRSVEEVDILQQQISRLMDVQRDLAKRDDQRSRREAELTDNSEVLNQHVRTLSTQLQSFMDSANTSERNRLTQLEIENAMLRRDKEQLMLQLEKSNSDSQALRETLNRKLVRARIDNETIRHEVREEISSLEVDFEKMRSDLCVKLETAVIHFHKPEFEPNLGTFKEALEHSKSHVDAQARRMQVVLDSIGSNDEAAAAMSLHTNLPPFYKKELSYFTRDQMMNLVDVLSYEDGVVAAIGRAIHAKGRTNTQVVFN